jgi:predicted dienelactone hydrolase
MFKKLRSRLGFVLAVLLLSSTAASAEPVARPDQPGPYYVGVTTFSAVMTGDRVTRVQVFYPTIEPPDQNFRYTINTPVGSYQLRSALGAAEDAPALPILCPLVVYDHAGAVAGADFQRVAQFPLHELMATHGFVTVVALHSGNAVTRVLDLPMVIDIMLARNADPDDGFFASIDPTRIGISGYSAGGGAAVSAAAGWAANGIAADPRIKAMLVMEPAVNSLADASTLGIPYMAMGGTQSRFGLAVPDLIEATVVAPQSIYVLTPNATHLSYLTSMASEIDQTREAALLADPTLPEPLTTRTATNAAAARAYDLWNQGAILFPALGLGAGSGRNFCDRVGVNSVRSLDQDGDGFTDSPPLMVDDPLLLAPAIPEEVMSPMVKHYTVSFWKAFLEGDRRYMGYLTPGYAQRNELPALVTIE